MANKIMFGADLIKVLKEYKLNKLGEVPTKYKNGITTIDFIYGKEKSIDDLKYDKPYVEFSIDDETDGFISGTMYPNGGAEGIQFDSYDDIKYFMKNAKWTESKKSARKSLKESLNSDIKLMVNLIVDDLISEYTPREWDSLSDNEKFNVIRIKYFMYEGKSKYLSEVRDLVIENMNHPFDVVFESKKSMKESRASLHETNVEYGVERIKNKVKGSDVTYYFDDEDCFIDVTEKNGNLWAFTIDFGSGHVYMLEPKGDRGGFGADNEAFDVIISMLQGKRFNE